MAIPKAELEEKIEELADLMDSSVKMISETLKDNGIDLSEVRRKGHSVIQKALPFISEKRQQLELYLLNRQLSEVNRRIEEEIENKMKGEESPESEE